MAVFVLRLHFIAMVVAVIMLVFVLGAVAMFVFALTAVVVSLVPAAAVRMGDFATEKAGHGDPGGLLHAEVEL